MTGHQPLVRIPDEYRLVTVLDALNTTYSPSSRQYAAAELAALDNVPPDVLDGWPTILTRPRSQQFTAAHVLAMWDRAVQLGLIETPADVRLGITDPGSPAAFGLLHITDGHATIDLRDHATWARWFTNGLRTRTYKAASLLAFTVGSVDCVAADLPRPAAPGRGRALTEGDEP